MNNRYEIQGVLGEGGMGAVYKALDRELDRLVALKVIRPELARNPAILQRFKNELVLARKVTHKNVNRIFDLGESEGAKFISMEYVEGQDLKSLIRERGKLAPEEALRLVIQICRALDAAHSEGVVHRDLKPQNIMVDEQGKVQVMDFGLAASTEMTGFTQTGALLGTPEYMSPEQAKGEKADTRSDLFALGIVFYELLTGETPYKTDSAYSSLLKRTQERAVPVSKIDQSIPRHFSEIVSKCLEINPSQRYQAALEIIEDLEAQRRPQSPSMISYLPIRLRTVTESKIWVKAAAVAAVVSVAVILPLWFFWPSAPPPTTETTSLAILPFQNASGDANLDWLGPGLADMLATDVGASTHVRTVSSDRLHQILNDLRISATSSIDPAMLRRIAEFSNAQILVSGKYLKLGSLIRIDATLRDLEQQRTVSLKAEASSEDDVLRAVGDLANSIRDNLALSPEETRELQAGSFTPSTKSVVALRSYNEGRQLARQGTHLEAVKQFEASTQEDPEFALAFSKLAESYAALGYAEKAEQISRQAVDLSYGLSSPERSRIVAIHARLSNNLDKAIESYENLARAAPADTQIQFELGTLYESKGDRDRARQHYAQVLTNDPKHLDALYAAGRVEVRSRNYETALDYFNRALSLSIQLENQEAKARILHALGVSYRQLDKPEEALRYYQEALALREQLGDRGGLASTLNEIARVQERLGNLKAAQENYFKALGIRREIGDKKGIAQSLLALGLFYGNSGRYAEASKSTKEALRLYTELGDESFEALCLSNIGVFYVAQGQFSDALIYYQRALQLREKLEISGEIADTLYNLADIYATLGQHDEALSHYLRALELWRDTGDKLGVAVASSGMGNLFAHQGRFGASLGAQQDALKTVREVGGSKVWLGEILAAYANALILIGRPEEATKVLDEALVLARELNNKALMARVHNYQGDRFFYSGDSKSARSLYEEALRSAQGTQDRQVLLQSKLNLARVSVDQGQAQTAVPRLKALLREAEGLGFKYLATEASAVLGEALLAAKNNSQARASLEATLRDAEKLGLQALQARAHFFLGETLAAGGDEAAAMRHYRNARQLLDEMQQEAQSDTLLSRRDFNSIYTRSAGPRPAQPR